MLSTFLSQLQSYFSKYFFVGCVLPVVAFAFINCLGAYLTLDAVRKWTETNIAKWADTASVTAAVGVALVIFAYLLSALSTFLRRQLEGSWWRPLAQPFIPAQNRRRQHIIDAVYESAMNMADLDLAPQWEEKLRKAREQGMRASPNRVFNAPDKDDIEETLKHLEQMRKEHKMLGAGELETLTFRLVDRLSACDADASHVVSREHERLVALIDYGRMRATARHAAAQNELNSNFGAQELAPTKMGNIANTIQSYALRRYHCNLEVIWSNLQRVVQRDEKSQAALQEAKTQLDFLIACCWLTLVWTLLWMVVTGLLIPNRTGFLSVALGGPAIAYMWYRAAAEQYRSFADVAMTCLDSFRLDLLSELHLRSPADVEDERLIWQNFDRLTTYGENRNFRYETGKQP